jgi:hypothetical protein
MATSVRRFVESVHVHVVCVIREVGIKYSALMARQANRDNSHTQVQAAVLNCEPMDSDPSMESLY